MMKKVVTVIKLQKNHSKYVVKKESVPSATEKKSILASKVTFFELFCVLKNNCRLKYVQPNKQENHLNYE